MTRRHVHYEAAFEDYLRSRGWPYVPVNEQRKAIFAGARVKSFDFLVYPPDQNGWLVDVKGRKFPYDGAGGKRYWENWVTREDLEGLKSWEGVFGGGFTSVLVFAYWLVGPPGRLPTADVHGFRGEYYSFLWVSAAAYGANARPRSPKWETFSLSGRTFQKLAAPVGEWGDGNRSPKHLPAQAFTDAR